MIKKGAPVTVLIALILMFVLQNQRIGLDGGQLSDYYQQQKSDQMVAFAGKVKKILADDLQGSRHQKFIVQSDDLTVLIAHNIDLAPRIPLSLGDEITAYGEYEWNEKGGVVHWTHKDPAGKHANGWIKHAGKTYE